MTVAAVEGVGLKDCSSSFSDLFNSDRIKKTFSGKYQTQKPFS